MINIAVVDDELQILEMLENYFNRVDGFNVVSYQNARQAIASIELSSVDLVLLDIMMPQMDGLEILEKLRDKMPNLPVVMMTAYSTLDRVLESHKLGAEHYLLKPFKSLNDVENKIKKILDI